MTLLLLILMLCLPAIAHAQLWNGVLPTNRGMDWSKAGADPAVMNATRTQCGTTKTAGTSIATINAAIAACASGTYVLLGAGTFAGTGWVVAQDGVTLRGSGPTQTRLDISANTSCNLWSGGVCLGGRGSWTGGYNPGTSQWIPSGQFKTWDAGYTQGTTVITLDSVTNLFVGAVLILDQCDLGSASGDDGGLIQSSDTPLFSNEGGDRGRYGITGDCTTADSGRRTTMEFHRVTAINSTDVTIDPPILSPAWSSGLSPRAWFPVAAERSTGVGLENLTVDCHGAFCGEGVVIFVHCYDCWVKNVRIHGMGRGGVSIQDSGYDTVKDSYFYYSESHASQAYGVEFRLAGMSLVENNIFHNYVAAPLGPCGGCVIAYNFGLNSYLGTTTNTLGMFTTHTSGGAMTLFEGNQTDGATADPPHGNSILQAFFRNHFRGRDYCDPTNNANGTSSAHIDGCSLTGPPIDMRHHARGYSFVGNVLGHPSVHSTYESTSSPDATTIWNFGNGSLYGMSDDAVVVASALRWGNYDTVNDATRFVTSEIPTAGIPRLTGATVPTCVPTCLAQLTPSWYLSSKPTTWWNTPWGEPKWPPLGPDVTGGNHHDNLVSGGIGGHADMIPAMLCYYNTARDTGYPLSVTHTDRGFVAFDASTCYLATGSDTTPPAAPTGVMVN
jgi:hypothetical protein